MYVALAAILGLAAGLGVFAFLLFGPIPVIDRGLYIFAATSLEARRVLVEDVLPLSHLMPGRRLDSLHVKRAVMSDKMTVISVTADEVWEEMGRPVAGFARVVWNPVNTAGKMVAELRRNNFQAEMLGPDFVARLDPDIRRGAMVFVKTDALEGSIIVIRKHVFFMGGGMPPKWKKRS